MTNPFDSLFHPTKGPATMILEKSAEKTVAKVKEQVDDNFSMSHFLGIDTKIQELAEHLKEQAKLTPDPNDDNIDYLQKLRDYADTAIATRFAPTWFKDLMVYLMAMISDATHGMTQWMFSQIYTFISSITLYTPLWLFENTWFPSSVMKFTGISVGIVIVFSMIEGIKRMLKMSNTPYEVTLKRLPLALGVSAASPFVFTNLIRLLNKVTKLIINLGGDEIAANKLESVASISMYFEPLNVLMMIVFTILFGYVSFPLILFHGKRWFDILAAGLCTPFAMSAYLFHSTEKYFHMWIEHLKSLGMVQLAYAFFVTILGLLMFATPSPTSLGGLFVKLLTMLGCIHTLSKPPAFVERMLDAGSDVFQNYKDIKNKVHEIKGVGSKIKKMKPKAEDGLIGAARIGGKFYKWIKR